MPRLTAPQALRRPTRSEALDRCAVPVHRRASVLGGRCILPRTPAQTRSSSMVLAISQKRFSAVSVVAALACVLASEARSQDLSRVNQDELASFYGRMN